MKYYRNYINTDKTILNVELSHEIIFDVLNNQNSKPNKLYIFGFLKYVEKMCSQLMMENNIKIEITNLNILDSLSEPSNTSQYDYVINFIIIKKQLLISECDKFYNIDLSKFIDKCYVNYFGNFIN